METWIWETLSVLVLVLLFHFLRRRRTPAKLPPSPPGHPIIGHLHLLGHHPHRDLSNLAKKHGPIISLRLGFIPAIIASSPSSAELFLKTHDNNFCTRPPQEAARFLGYDQNDLIFAPYGDFWRNMRKLITLELLSSSRINQFKEMRKKEVDGFVSGLRSAASVGETVDLTKRIGNLIGDMNSLMVFGRKFEDEDLDEKGFKAVITEAVDLGTKFNVADYFPFVGVLDLQGMNRRMRCLARVFDGFLERIVDEHVKDGLEKKKKGEIRDFVDTMLGIMESGDARFEFDRRHVKAILLDLMIAGLDTSSTTIEWTLAELIRHPTVMKKLRDELDAVVGIDNTVEESHVDKLVYLNCIVKESMRLHPFGPLLLPHEAIEDRIIEGYFIPKGSRILVNIWAIGMDPNVWPEPERFYPERFIGSSIDVKGKDFELLPFGSGRRGCPGMQLGLTLVRFVVAQLVHCFHWELPEGMDHSELDMTEQFGMAVARAMPLRLIPSYRLSA